MRCDVMSRLILRAVRLGGCEGGADLIAIVKRVDALTTWLASKHSLEVNKTILPSHVVLYGVILVFSFSPFFFCK